MTITREEFDKLAAAFNKLSPQIHEPWTGCRREYRWYQLGGQTLELTKEFRGGQLYRTGIGRWVEGALFEMAAVLAKNSDQVITGCVPEIAQRNETRFQICLGLLGHEA